MATFLIIFSFPLIYISQRSYNYSAGVFAVTFLLYLFLNECDDNSKKTFLDEKKFNFLYLDGDSCHFMDNNTYEQVEISKSIAGEQYKLLKENLEVTISFMEDKPISIELPNNIECTIETTDAAIKNQTASSSYKPALLDCGIKINVPPFIESGEKIIIDTRTLEYVKRVN